jgi:hypothetical protein
MLDGFLSSTDLERLIPLAGFFLLAMALIALLKFMLRSRTGEPPTDQYQRREELFTPAERAFYAQLEAAVGEDYDIFGKVRLADVIEPRDGLSKSDRQSALNRISSKHLDFVLTAPRSMAAVCAIELDDASHLRRKRIERDEFVDGAMAYAGMPLIRFEVQPTYSVDEIRDSVAEALSDTRDLKEPRLFS